MCIPGLCEASTDVRRGESLIYGEVNASLMLMNFKPSDLPMALCENIAIFRRNIPCPWNLLQDRLIPGIVDGYRKVLGRVCIKAQSGIFCLQRRTMGMGPIPRWAKGALQIPAADLRPSSRKSDNILRCIWPGPTTNRNTGRSIEWPISLPPAIPTFDPLPTIVDHCPLLATLIAVISRKYVKAIFYTLCSQQQGTNNNRNDCKYSAKKHLVACVFPDYSKMQIFSCGLVKMSDRQTR